MFNDLLKPEEHLAHLYDALQPVIFWTGQVHACILTTQKKCSSSTWDAFVCDVAASANRHLRTAFESVTFWNSLDEAKLNPCDLSSLVLALTKLIFEKWLSNQTVWGSCASQAQILFGFQLLPGVSGPTGGKLKGNKQKKPIPCLCLGHLLL